MGDAKQSKFRAVVGVDFAPSSRHAILEAVRLADRISRAALYFVHVFEVGPDLHDAELIDRLSERFAQTMGRLEHYVRDTLYVGTEVGWGLELAYHVRVGPVARELQQVAVDSDADLIVLGKPAKNGLRKLFHKGSVEELVRTAHVPVVVAHPKDFRGMPRSPEPDPPRPGQDLTRSGTYATVELRDAARGGHIAGML